MVVVSRPIDPETTDASNPVVYSPLTVSGLSIGFNLERIPRSAADVPADEQALAGLRVEQLNLTPRLVAKLLTQSYREQTNIKAAPPYEWVKDNPVQLSLDPDFLQFNPEFRMLEIAAAAQLQRPRPAGRGHRLGPAGVGVDPRRPRGQGLARRPARRVRDEGQPRLRHDGGRQHQRHPVRGAGPRDLPQERPALLPGSARRAPTARSSRPPCAAPTGCRSPRATPPRARQVRAADDGARIAGPDPSAISQANVWKKDGPQPPGQRAIMGMVDTPHSTVFGLQSARLSRAGDGGSDRKFIAPTEASLTAGVNAMKPGKVAKFLEPDPKADAPDAYPLTTITYAADHAARPGDAGPRRVRRVPRLRHHRRPGARAQGRSAPAGLRAAAPRPPGPGEGGGQGRSPT